MYQVGTEVHSGRTLRCYTPRPGHLDAMFRATAVVCAQRPAIVDGDTRLSYGALNGLVQRAAAGLLAHGVRPADRVAIAIGNRAEFVVSLLAVARIGAISVPIGTRLRRPEIEYICAHSGVAAILHEADLASELPDLVALGARFSVGGPSTGSHEFAELLGHGDTVPECPAVEDDTFGILYTSGTTGRPKGAALTHLGAIHSCIHWQQMHEMCSDDISVLPIPVAHVSGLCGVIIPMLYVGGCLVLMREFKAHAFLKLAAEERITHALLVPAMYGLFLLDPTFAQFDLSCWRIAVYGGAPMPEATIHGLSQRLPELQLCNGYGATETTSPAVLMPLGQGISHSESIGKVVPCGDLQVMDESGSPVPTGDEGEFWIAGPMIAKEYWADEAATRAAFVNGYWKSGDIGTVDAEGYVRIKDRKKDVVNRGGYKIYPAEVENVLREHPGVLDAAVVGRPDSILTERVVAFVQPRDGALGADQLREFCRSRMADYKIPEFVVMIPAPLPRNANGKIQKALLRQQALELQPAPR